MHSQDDLRTARRPLRALAALAAAALLAALAAVPAAAQPLINELVFNHTGSDTNEYVEVFGDPSTDYSAFTVLELEGDSGSTPGVVDGVFAVGTTDSAGLWWTDFLADELENGTVTLLLVEGFTGSLGDDLDTDDDGLLDATPWTFRVDDVAVSDGGAGDLAYAAVVLDPGFDGVGFTPGGASRIPDGADTDTVADWLRNDFDGEGLPGFVGTPEEGEAINTPGLPNEAVSIDPPPGVVRICDIQGPGLSSPFVGQAVTTEGNVVTAVAPDGFFVQSPAACDGDPESSDGIFVFTGSAPAVAEGDLVDVDGTVAEFFEQTELEDAAVTVVGSSQPLPAPVIFDETVPSPDQPQPDNELERFEGMLVRFVDGVTNAPTDRFGDVAVVAKPTPVLREPGIEFPGLPGLPVWDGSPEVFEIDPDALGLPDPDVARATPIVECEGPLTFSFGDYVVAPKVLTLGAEPILPQPVRDRQPGEYTVATLNLLRFFDELDDPDVPDDVIEDPAVVQDRLERFSLHVREVLKAPDVLVVQEVDDESLLQRLGDQMAADDPSLSYQAIVREGNDVFSSLDVGFLVRDTASVMAVKQVFADLTWEFDGVVDILFDRPPLLVVVSLGGTPTAIVGNHLRSLGGIDDPDDGDRVRNKRDQQATRLSQLVQKIQDLKPTVPLIVAGDLNAFPFTDGYVDVVGQVKGDPDPLGALIPATDLVDPDLTDRWGDLPGDEVYDFVFDGNAQALDYLLTSATAAPLVSGYEVGRGNADASERFEETPPPDRRELAVSDHDGVVVYLTP